MAHPIPPAMIRFTLLLSLLLPLVTASSARAQEATTSEPAEPAPAAQPAAELPGLPWHLANIWWNFEDSPSFRDFQSLEIEVSIDRDLPENLNLYIAPVGLGEINGISFYGGLQTHINGFLGPEDRERKSLGRGGIFSRWSHDKQTPLTPNHLRRHDDGLQETAGYEGEFASIRRPVAWGRGTYTYRIRKGEPGELDGKPATWFTASITDQQSGETTEIGSLLFEGETFTFQPRHSAFVEIYATAWIRNTEIHPVVVTFGYPRVNGLAPALDHAFALYPNEGSQGSPDAAVVTADGPAAVVTVTEIFTRDEAQRRHPLELTTPAAPEAAEATDSPAAPAAATPEA